MTAGRAAEVVFEKQVISERFVAEGCAVADFDQDGHPDIAAGNSIWHGPEFTRRTEYTPPRDNPAGPAKTPYDPARGYSNYFLMFAHDFNGDGWQDILVYDLPGEPAVVFANPGKDGGEWAKHAVFKVADGESPGLADIDGDGRPELFCQSSGPEIGGRLGFAQIDWAEPFAQARFRPITPRSPENDKKYFRYTHGAGLGDVNGDGRVDILSKDGWFEQPASIAADAIWPFHPGPFGPAGARGGAQMLVFDVDGDGRNDVVTSYDAHGYGIGWFRQEADGSFTEHAIVPAGPAADGQDSDVVRFSQPHALAAADIDGDGLTDFVTGKRRWAHGPSARALLVSAGAGRAGRGHLRAAPDRRRQRRGHAGDRGRSQWRRQARHRRGQQAGRVRVSAAVSRPRVGRLPVRGARGSPCRVAGRSLRASCPSLARCWLVLGIHAFTRQQRRLHGTGNPSRIRSVHCFGSTSAV